MEAANGEHPKYPRGLPPWRYVPEVKKQARTDSLTGLWNRRMFEERMGLALERFFKGREKPRTEGPAQAKRSRDNGPHPHWVVIADIDNFKLVNDDTDLGHPAGDYVLQKVAECLQNNTRFSDIVARLGGEEFVFGLLDADKEVVKRITEELRAAIEGLSLKWKSKPIPITLSFGVSSTDTAHDLTSIVAQADKALYAAKRGGRNRVEFFNADTPKKPVPAVPEQSA